MSNKIDKVVVLMSTYNGQKYIEQQIESIEQQQDVYIDLVIRDDGSTDQTVAIINNLTKKYDNIILINGGNLGYVKSFSSLVRYAYEQYADDCMFAFVDQDDIWKEAKLKIACENIASCDQRIPLLFCSNSMLIDSYCKEVCEFRPYAPTFKKGTVLYYGTVQGFSIGKLLNFIIHVHLYLVYMIGGWFLFVPTLARFITLMSLCFIIEYMEKTLLDHR